MGKKGYYIKKGIKDQSIYLYINKPDFIKFLNDMTVTEWVKFRIYERDTMDVKGFTHNMELIQNMNISADNESKAVNE